MVVRGVRSSHPSHGLQSRCLYSTTHLCHARRGLRRRNLAHSGALSTIAATRSHLVAAGLDLQEAFTLANMNRVTAMCAEASRIVSVCAREAAAGWASCHLRFTANFGLQRKPWGVDHIGTALPEIEFDIRSSDQIPATWTPVTVSVTTPCPHKLLGTLKPWRPSFLSGWRAAAATLPPTRVHTDKRVRPLLRLSPVLRQTVLQRRRNTTETPAAKILPS